MRQRINLSLLLALLGVPAAIATPLTPSQARAVAEQFALSTPSPLRAPSAGGAGLTLAHTAVDSATGVADYYAFNRAGGGFVLVAGDDCVLPVMGYSDSGSFDTDSLPDNMRWWLGEYSREISYARSTSAAPRRMTQLDHSVEPLVKTQWDQGSPFNDRCPTFNDGRNRAVSGCVATAVTQIMNVHQWPPVGVGSNTYDCRVNGEAPTTLTADFSAMSFKWGLMRDNYSFGRSTEAQKAAVAELTSAVGIAVEMMYGASSGAHSIKAFRALRDYFRYDGGMAFRLRDFMPLDQWEQLLRDELDAGRPIYYAGQSGSGGHAFVFDGYNTGGYFHVNWGWGGRSDGYFACSMLNPGAMGGAAFNSGQEAIVGIRPDRGGDAEVQPLQGYMADFGTRTASAELGDEVPLSMINFTYLGEGEPGVVDFAVEVRTPAGELVALLPVTRDEVMNGYTYYFSDDEPISMTLPADMAEGDYRLHVVYSLDSLATVVPFVRKADSAGYVAMTVAGGRATFDNNVVPIGSPLLVSAIEPSAVSMPAGEVRGEALVRSVGGLYSGTLTMRVLRRQGSDYVTLAQSSREVAFDHNGEQRVLAFDAAIDAAEGDTCLLVLADPAAPDQWWCEPAEFVVGPWPTPVASITTPATDSRVNFGEVLIDRTYVETLTIRGENLTGGLTLSITGDGAARFSVTPSTLTQAKGMAGAKVNVRYSAFALGNHEARLIISGGGLEQPFSIALQGAAYMRGDINGDDVVDVADANILINILLKKQDNDWPKLTDLNNDGVIDVSDLNELISSMVHK